MPVKTKVDDKKQLTIKTVTGEPTFEEGMLAFKQFWTPASAGVTACETFYETVNIGKSAKWNKINTKPALNMLRLGTQ